jgi:hypothetical protein
LPYCGYGGINLVFSDGSFVFKPMQTSGREIRSTVQPSTSFTEAEIEGTTENLAGNLQDKLGRMQKVVEKL